MNSFRFRWAFCQLDILGRLISLADIRDALKKLPETLDETYERILDKIPAEHVQYARRALHLLAVNENDLSLYDLTEAVIVDDIQYAFSPDRRFLDQFDLLDICSCLIIEDEYYYIQLAHYTVKEYLVSGRVRPTIFKTSEAEAKTLTVKLSLIYLLNVSYEGMPTAAERFLGPPWRNEIHPLEIADQELPFFRIACCAWCECPESVSHDAKLQELIMTLLNPNECHFNDWWELQAAYFIELDRDPLPKWKFFPECSLNVPLAYL
jgi:hypothetical protein